MKQSETIRVPSRTKQKLEEIMEERGYPSISYTIVMIVEKFKPDSMKRAFFLCGVSIGIFVGAVVVAFMVSLWI